jgi:hypothetical protein
MFLISSRAHMVLGKLLPILGIFLWRSLCYLLLPNTITSITIYYQTTTISILPTIVASTILYNKSELLIEVLYNSRKTVTPSILKWLLIFSDSDLNKFGLSTKDCDAILDALVSANCSTALDAISMQVKDGR